MSNLAESFKQIFISQKNSGYLFELITTKILNAYPNLRTIFFNHLNSYKENMNDLQQLIFKDYFNTIYNKSLSSGNADLEDILIQL